MPQASMVFFGNDWRSDARLRMSSPTARGVWIDLLTLMMEARPFGSLLIGGKQPSVELLSALTVTPVETMTAAISELDANGVFSKDADGTIYCRRMRRDAARSARNKANGLRGGNPALSDNPSDNRPSLKPQGKGIGKGKGKKETLCSRKEGGGGDSGGGSVH